jgi:hypothetical protein
MGAPRYELPETVRRLFRGRAPRVDDACWGRWAPAVRDVAARHRLLPLVVDADGLLALGADGQVVTVRWTSGAEPSAVADVRTRDLAVLRALPRHRELRALVPARGPGDMDCAHCRGIGAAFEPTLPGLVCVCGGLGFFPSRWCEADVADEPPPPPSRRVAHAVEPDHIDGTGAQVAIAMARAIAAPRRPAVRPLAMTAAPPVAEPSLHWRPRQRGVRRLALAMLLALVCGALVVGWSAWAASPTSPAVSSAPGRP